MPRREVAFIPKPTPIEIKRFFQKVRKTNKCWLWCGAIRNKDGYGAIAFSGKTRMAHRVSYAIHFEVLPVDKIVCHTCDNPICVNPKHLYLGTDADNWRDCQERGREVHPQGECHGKAILTASDVKFIFECYKPRKVPKKVFAELFGVSVSCISHIIRGRNWKHLSR